MIWYNNPFFWIGAVIILILMGIALAIAIYLRRQRVENRFTVAIENGGNVPSRYLLRLEQDEGRSLVYKFTQKGESLPVEKLAGLPGSSQAAKGSSTGGARNTLDQAQSASFTVSQFGPSAVSSPLSQASSMVSEGEREVGTIQYYLRKLGIASGGSKPAESEAAAQPALDDWALTGEVQAGTVLPVELTVRKKGAVDPQGWPFLLISRTKENDKAAEVTQEGTGVVRFDFWTRPVVPELLIIGVAALLLVIMALLTSVS